MSSVQPLFSLLGVSSKQISKEKCLLIEADLYVKVNLKLKKFFRDKYSNYFQLMKLTLVMEEAMLDANYLRFIINDIISTGEYTISGIACYTQTPEDVIYDCLIGSNNFPSASLLQRLIELHRLIRRELYSAIIKEIADEYLVMSVAV